MRKILWAHGPAALLNLLMLAVITFAMLEADIMITFGP